MAHVETLLLGYFNYINHYVSLKQLLFETQWSYGTSEVGPYDDILLSVGFLHWILPIVSILTLATLKKKHAILVFSLTLSGWISLFMTHSKSAFIWDNIKILSFVQFPWRFLALSTFFFSFASGSLVLAIKDIRLKKYWLTFLIAMTFFLYRSYFTPRVWLDVNDQEKFSGESWQRQQTISIFDYLPIYAEKPPGSKAPDEPEIIEGEADILSGRKGSDWQEWNVKVLSQKVVLRLGLFYYPNWIVSVDKKIAPINYENNVGAIDVEVYRGDHTIFAKLKNTPIRSVSNTVTLVSLILIPIYLRRSKIFAKPKYV